MINYNTLERRPLVQIYDTEYADKWNSKGEIAHRIICSEVVHQWFDIHDKKVDLLITGHKLNNKSIRVSLYEYSPWRLAITNSKVYLEILKITNGSDCEYGSIVTYSDLRIWVSNWLNKNKRKTCYLTVVKVGEYK